MRSRGNGAMRPAAADGVLDTASSSRPALTVSRPPPRASPAAVLRELDGAGAIMLDGEDIYLAH